MTEYPCLYCSTEWCAQKGKMGAGCTGYTPPLMPTITVGNTISIIDDSDKIVYDKCPYCGQVIGFTLYKGRYMPIDVFCGKCNKYLEVERQIIYKLVPQGRNYINERV